MKPLRMLNPGCELPLGKLSNLSVLRLPQLEDFHLPLGLWQIFNKLAFASKADTLPTRPTPNLLAH